MRQFFFIPLDKPRKDPGLRGNNRPSALLRPLMELCVLVIVGRFVLFWRLELSPDHYANQSNMSTETLLSDLDSFVGKNRARGRHVLIAGLDLRKIR